MNYTKKIKAQLTILMVAIMAGIFSAPGAAAQDGKLMRMQKKAAEIYVSAWNEGNVDNLDKFFTKDAVRKLPESIQAGNSNSLVELKKEIKGFRTLFPDVNVATEEIIMQDDTAVIRWTLTGTNKVKAMGYPGDGSKVNLKGISVVRFENGKITEETVYYDVYTFRKQMGLAAESQTKTAQAKN